MILMPSFLLVYCFYYHHQTAETVSWKIHTKNKIAFLTTLSSIFQLFLGFFKRHEFPRFSKKEIPNNTASKMSFFFSELLITQHRSLRNHFTINISYFATTQIKYNKTYTKCILYKY